MMISFFCRFIYFLVLSSALFLTFPAISLFANTTDYFAELEEGEVLNNKAQTMLIAGEYNKVELEYQEYLEQYASGKMTVDDLTVKFLIFSNFTGLEDRFDLWIEKYPKSYPARLARGMHLVRVAWDRRGKKLAKETTDEQFTSFEEILKKAKIDLEQALKLNPRPIEAYHQLIRISKGLSLGKERQLLDAALELDPKAYFPRHQYLIAIAPKWGGDLIQMGKFMDECNNSAMSIAYKKRLDAKYYNLVAEQANLDKDYKTASDYYLKSYNINKNPHYLELSGKLAVDGNLIEIAYQRYTDLIKEHPQYEYGFTQRGLLSENHFKNYESAFKDYLAAANLGNGWAQNRVGWYYMTGTCVITDLIKAKYYLDLAAKQGNNSAKANLKIWEQLNKKSMTDKITQ